MAILAYPVLSNPSDFAITGNPFAESRSIAFEALDGSVLFPPTGSEFVYRRGVEGLGMPPRQIITKRIPGMDGARLAEIRTDVREVFIPVFIRSSSSHVNLLGDVDRLADLFDYRRSDYAADDGTLNIVAYSAQGVRRLRCAYSSGMETGYGSDTDGSFWAGLGLHFLSVQPYWYGDRWETPIIQQSVAINTFASFPVRLSSDVVLGLNIPVTVEGNADSWITVDLVGPADSVTITGSGISVSIPGGLADLEKAQIVMDPRGRTATFDGVKDWSRVGPTTKWKPLQPGSRKLSISITGANSNTQAQISGPTLWERPW